MTDGPVSPPPGGGKGLIARVKDILLSPKTEWGVIDAEPTTIAGIYTSYVVILAAIGPICGLIGSQLVGISMFGVTYKPPIAYSVGQAVLGYVMSLILVYVSALIIDALAPSFGGTKNQLKAFKVAAYSSTATWVAGVVTIIPMLGILVLLAALYGLYLLYLGLPRLMRVSEDKAIGYTVVIVVVWIVLYFVVAMVVAALVTAFFGSMLVATGGATVIRY